MDIFGQLFMNGVVSFSIYAIFGAGFTLLYGAYRFIDMSYASVAVIAAYVMVYLNKFAGLNLYFAFVCGLFAGIIVSQFLFYLIWVPLRERKAKSLVLFLTSLGLFTFFQALISLLFGVSFHTIDRPDWMNRTLTFFGATLTGIQFLILGLALFLLLITALLLFRSAFGRQLRAVFDDEEVAKIVGINTQRIIALLTVICSGFASLGGMLIALDIGINPTINLWILLSSISPAIVGGLSSFFGAYIGAFILGLAENVGIWWISGEWKVAVSVLILLLFLLFRPQGILKR